MPISYPLEFTKYLGNETEEIVWHVFLQNLRRLHYFYRELPKEKGNNSVRVQPEFQGLRVTIIALDYFIIGMHIEIM